MASNGFQPQGFDALNEVLAGLPGKFGAQTVDKILRKAAQPYLKKAKELSSNQDVTGDTTKSLGIIANRKTNSITVGPRRGGQYKGYVAHILEYGAAPHRIAAKAAGGLLSFAGTLTHEVNHPGIAAQPFLRPAFDATHQQVVDSVKQQCAEIIESGFKSVFK
jgi:HK97 gp10 family phage protein